jgi:non-lysosomal glucosylceramidase
MSSRKEGSPCGSSSSSCCRRRCDNLYPPTSLSSSSSPCANHADRHDAVDGNVYDEDKRSRESFSPVSVDDCLAPALVDDDADPWVYKGERLQALNFPLGGFGTGNILLQGDGSLQGWTLQNQFHNPEYTPLHCLPGNSFAIAAWYDDDESHREAYLLQSAENYTVANQRAHFREEKHVSQHKVNRLRTLQQHQQLPGIPNVEMKCCYPIATVRYRISTTFPLEVVEMEALTPLIPTNIRDSSYPLAVFTFRLTNRSSDRSVSVDLMQSAMNFVGWDGHTDCCHAGTSIPFWGQNVNTPFVDDVNGCAGIVLTSQRDIPELSRHGSITLVAATIDNVGPTSCGTTDPQTAAPPSPTTTTTSVRVIPGVTTEDELFQKFTNKEFDDPAVAPSTPPSVDGTSYMGAVVQSITSIPPKATVRCRFVLAWYFPNRPCTAPRDNLPKHTWGNQYANWFADSNDVVTKFCPVSEDLIDATRCYTTALYSTTIPYEVLESAAGRVACTRCPTMFWTKDGVVLGNEGNDCCPLNCTHVYGYTTLLERLFPDVARDMRISDFVRNFDPTDGCTMRFGRGGFAIDGSLANVIKTYLVVLQSDPKLEFLQSVWPNVKRQMDIVFTKYLDKDGVVRSAQQNTYDSAMLGANTFIGSYVVTALKAAAAMASLAGDANYAKKCLKQAKETAGRYEELCWNEEFGYYIADVNETNCENSYGPGCFIDQLSAVGLSLACGFGAIFNPAHEAVARQAILRNNVVVKPPFEDQQHHFYYGDAGIRVCTYPHGKLGRGMPYTQLVSAGFTYPVVAGMIYDGNWMDARRICQMIRARQSGIHRSPWNEPECGLFYARSMAAWNLFDQACGFFYDSTKGAIGFAPKINATAFSCFCVFHQGFGQFEQRGDDNLAEGTAKICVLYGSLNGLRIIHLQSTAHVVIATLDGTAIDASIEIGGIIKLAMVSIPAGSTLEIRLSSPCHDESSKEGVISFKNIGDRKDSIWWYLFPSFLLVGIISWTVMTLAPFAIWVRSCLPGVELS